MSRAPRDTLCFGTVCLPDSGGPLVIRGFDTITVREVLQQIFTYLHNPLTEGEVNWISRTPPNRNRLELAKFIEIMKSSDGSRPMGLF